MVKNLVVTAILAAAIAGQASAVSAMSDGAADASPNVKRVSTFDFAGAEDTFSGGTDIDFSGRYAYVGQMGPQGGVHIYDIRPSPKKVGFLACPGGQNDVAVVRPGLIALGYHDSLCGASKGGISLVDVSKPQRPKVLGTVPVPGLGTHTLTTLPGTSLIYSSPGGWDQEASAAGVQASVETIIDASDPLRPEIIGTFDPVGAGCHDLSFLKDGAGSLGFCAGDSSTQIWDMTDPLAPKTLSTIVNPLISFHHSAEATNDGTLLAIGDETIATECAGGTIGSIWFYDITDPATPRLSGHYDVPRGPQPSAELDYTCTAHNFKFIPGTHMLVAAWFKAGMNVVDVSDPALPSEVAYYVPEAGSYWSAYPLGNRIFASGVPGLDVLEVEVPQLQVGGS